VAGAGGGGCGSVGEETSKKEMGLSGVPRDRDIYIYFLKTSALRYN
jgi:hypothetical protein